MAPQLRNPPRRKGSMADVPKDLMDCITDLEKLFTVDKQRINELCDEFVKEFEKGLTEEGSSIPQLPTWVLGFPNGEEKGTYLALDMGGTNLRVCEITLMGHGKFDILQSKYRMDPSVKTSTAEELFGYIADCLKQFVHDHHEGVVKEELHLGFTFSYPCDQHAIDHGILQRWTKGFDVKGVEGVDVVPLFEAALKEKGVPIKLTALINDTTGALIASNYAHPDTKMGVIFGTGCNAAYMEVAENIPKVAKHNLPPDTPMAINCEWGAAFSDRPDVLPRTKYDVIIDKESPRPGQQAFEKMIAGLYLGEVFRLALLDLHQQGHIFLGQSVAKLQTSYTIDTEILSLIELDPFENLRETIDVLETKLGIQCNEQEAKLVRRLAELIGTRSARLSACGVAAIAKKAGLTKCKVGADGSVFNLYPHFKARGAEALRDIFGDAGDDIDIVHAEDGSGVGAALIAALTLERVKAAGLSRECMLRKGVSHAAVS
ncbi:hypothetical protein G7K_3853-t1 [Saitoella complicata NRRL Y-17804]|uniref:Phosphotransferase n=1 Tax=Saitoella complicata (strain BCRC 22490 / CBS 7301 / JCM 7358 / NBRC 10748 / NRRL Y-17804) TaxID=698492 RepID=A0A0E9NIR9_SAICN|nr:hypothetical protein G7K_3853-t1 [Saitoella complicata NRRL Y-17804]